MYTDERVDHTTQELRDLIIEEEREKAREQLAAKEKDLEELLAHEPGSKLRQIRLIRT